jgi:hypothetical protein
MNIKKNALLGVQSKLKILGISFFAFLFLLMAPDFVLALDPPSTNNFGLNPAATNAFQVDDVKKVPLQDAASATGISVLIGRAVGIVLGFLGALFFGLVVYAGLKWMTARGNDTQIKDAQKIMRAAIIGLAIVLGAYAITRIMGEILK